MSAVYQPEGAMPRPTSMSLTAQILADADTIEISEGCKRLEMYSWEDDRRTWTRAGGSPVSGTTLAALIDLARKSEALTLVAWNNGRRLI